LIKKPSIKPIIRPIIAAKSSLAENVCETYSIKIIASSETKTAPRPAKAAAFNEVLIKYNEEKTTDVRINNKRKIIIIIT